MVRREAKVVRINIHSLTGLTKDEEDERPDAHFLFYTTVRNFDSHPYRKIVNIMCPKHSIGQ